MSVDELKEKIRIAENNGDSATAEALRNQLNQMSVNG